MRCVVPGRLELPTSTLSVWRSNQLSYRTGFKLSAARAQLHSFSILENRNSEYKKKGSTLRRTSQKSLAPSITVCRTTLSGERARLQKGGVPAAPSGTATLLRLSPNHLFHPRPTLAVTDFRRPRLSWLDGRCVQGPGTYSPRHG